MMSVSTSAARAPFSVFTMPSRAPLAVSITHSSSGATPCLRAKPAAAGVKSPLSSRALSAGGPKASTRLSGACCCSVEITTAKRRGVANQRTSPWASAACWRPATMLSRKARPSDFRAVGGSSSVPISISRLSVPMSLLCPRLNFLLHLVSQRAVRQRKPQGGARVKVGLGDRTGQCAYPENKALSFGHRDSVACVQ